MFDDVAKDRHSKASEADLITDEVEKAKREAENGLRQFDAVLQQVDSGLDPERPFRLRPSVILHLHRVALDGLSLYAGNWRPANVEIGGSDHKPPGAHLVPGLIEDLCDYINDNWQTKTAVHLSAYVLWRLNWIHPFSDGNGRTARALSYLVLCLSLKGRLSGTKTIPDQISRNKTPYYKALETIDATEKAGQVDLSALETLIADALAAQLLSMFNEATGSRG